MTPKLAAEFLGTFWLVLGGCGSAVLAATFPGVGIGLLGVSLAFGLTVLTGAYALGPISGGHFNPAVSVGLWAGGRFPACAADPLRRRADSRRDRGRRRALRDCERHARLRPRRRLRVERLWRPLARQVLLDGRRWSREVVMTFMFLMVIHGTTHRRAPVGFAGLAIGLCLTLIHLISIPVTNTSVNPARSTGRPSSSAAGRVDQLWLFWVGTDHRRAARRRGVPYALRARRAVSRR